MLSHAFVVILLAVAACILLGAFVALLVVVVELVREAVVMAREWHRSPPGGEHRRARVGVA